MQVSSHHVMISCQQQHLLPVDDDAEDPDHPPLRVHGVLLHVVLGLALRLAVAAEVRLVAVEHGAVEDGGARAHHEAVHRLLREHGQLRARPRRLGRVHNLVRQQREVIWNGNGNKFKCKIYQGHVLCHPHHLHKHISY